jgi:hypothetical protein
MPAQGGYAAETERLETRHAPSNPFGATSPVKTGEDVKVYCGSTSNGSTSLALSFTLGA